LAAAWFTVVAEPPSSPEMHARGEPPQVAAGPATRLIDGSKVPSPLVTVITARCSAAIGTA
jgi:hypothetical protein